ncbi:MAG: sugar-transfer associated ATP-grasp domain-containing protein [Dongiaceae bacterium]
MMKALQDNSGAYWLLAAGTGLAVALAALRAPIADWTLDGLSGAVALVGAAIAGTRLILGTPNQTIRRFWQLALVLLLIVGAGEFGGSWLEHLETRLGIDDLNDCLILLAAFVTLWFTTKLDHAPTAARWLLWTGFALHFLGTVFDVGDDSSKAKPFDPLTIESVTDLLQFLSLQFYLFGAVIFISALRSKRSEATQLGAQSVAAAGALRLVPPGVFYRPEPLGRCIRQDFSRYIARGSLRGMFRSRLYVEGARPIMFLIRTAWCLRRFGRAIAAAGRPLPLQAIDMLRLGWRDGIDPILYPTLELYRPERRGWADYALSRFEIGSGMLRRLHKLRPTPHGQRVNLGDKLAFHATCRAHGLPTPPILMHAYQGNIDWLDASRDADLDCDLFIKPRQSRGARNSFWLRRVAPLLWQTKSGVLWSDAELLEYLQCESRQRDLLLQPMLVNHPSIADFADRSLIAIRVITSMGKGDVPVITHAMLRVISKLEPRWQSKREHAARINLETGSLGMMCNDKDLWPGCWSDHHPVTGALVAGRVLHAWPEVRALALAAQRVFSDRMLVGWDIALTPDGPVLLEGNSYPDVHFLQRVHEQPIGFSTLGPLLLNALEAARLRDRHMIISKA